MIYFCVVHWKNTRWIGRQLRHIAGYTTGDYRIACFHTDLDGPIPEDSRWLFREETRIREHATKLDILAHEVCRQGARDDDILVFIDSDAFPVAPWEARLLPALDRHELTAVQRLEHLGDPHPHPCFCATTVGFWRRIGGTWASGHKWRRNDGTKATDVGGNLRKHLDRAGVEWEPILRSNTHNPHPIFFAVYGELIYHHGAGSRGKLSLADQREIDETIRREFPLRMAMLDLASRNLKPNRGVRIRSALSPKEEMGSQIKKRLEQIEALNNTIEAACDENLLTPRIIDDILARDTQEHRKSK